jgi:hypothetical protein
MMWIIIIIKRLYGMRYVNMSFLGNVWVPVAGRIVELLEQWRAPTPRQHQRLADLGQRLQNYIKTYNKKMEIHALSSALKYVDMGTSSYQRRPYLGVADVHAEAAKERGVAQELVHRLLVWHTHSSADGLPFFSTVSRYIIYRPT